MGYSLVGIDGNAFSVMGYTKKAMEECGYSKNEIDAYLTDAMSSDYDHLLSASVNIVLECNGKLGV